MPQLAFWITIGVGVALDVINMLLVIAYRWRGHGPSPIPLFPLILYVIGTLLAPNDAFVLRCATLLGGVALHGWSVALLPWLLRVLGRKG